MSHRFTIIKREYEDNALIAFIDLLGTRKLYETMMTEDQANKVLYVLLGEFDIKFSEYFTEKERKENFDVSIFADSIVISERLSTSNVIERLVDFLLAYQESILGNFESPSRAIIIKDSFFSFKLKDITSESILGSPYTTISLCGGKGVRFADKYISGLPIGVYVTDIIKKNLSDDQKSRVVPVQGESLCFIKKTTPIMPYIPDDTLDYVTKDREVILESLKKTIPDKDSFEKMAPWILVHLEKQNEIVRSNNSLQLDCSKLQAWLFHEDNLATNRFTVYMIAQSLLFMASQMSSSDNDVLISTRILALFGIPLGLVWLIEVVRASQNVYSAINLVKKVNDPTINELLNKFGTGIGIVPRLWLLSVLPVITIVGWILLIWYAR